MKEKLADIKYRLEERAAIMEENNATEAQRLASVQKERKLIRDSLKEGMGLHKANMAVIELEKEVDVFNLKGDISY